MSNIYITAENFQKALETCHVALKLIEDLGDSVGLADRHIGLGEIHRFGGELDEAQKHYLKAMQAHKRIGLETDLVVYLNLALTLMEQEKFGEASPLVDEALQQAVDSQSSGYIGIAHAVFLPVKAAEQNWKAFAHHLEEARTHLQNANLHDPDVTIIFQWGAEGALRGAQPSLAQEAVELAIDQWRALGRTEKLRVAESLKENI